MLTPKKMKLKTIALAALLVGPTMIIPITAQAQFLKVGNSQTFIKGANLPWLDGSYSYYLGLDPHNPSYGCAFNYAHMSQYLADMHNMGINVVRLWVNQADQGCTIDGAGNTTGVTALFWTNLDSTVYLAGVNGISLYITLNNGRADFLTNGTLLNNYINNALKPMIQRYKGDTRIFAIDAMNEIDGVVGGADGNYGSGPSWSQAQAYMRSIVAAVHGVDSSRLVSCSTGWHAWNNIAYFKGQGLDFYDFHLYNDNGSIPAASTLGLDKPVYVGETGQSTNSWNDSIQNTEFSNVLNNAKNGYAGAGIWAYQYPGCTDKYSMVNANGSWRQVCTTIKNFSYGGAGGGGGTGGTTPGNGTFKIVSRSSGKAVDAYNNGTADGTQIIQWTYSGGNNERWTLLNQGSNQYSIIGVASGKCLDVYNNSTANGAKVQLWTYGGGNNEKWTFAATSGGYYRVSPVHAPAECLDVTGASTADGALVEQWSYSGGTNQQWAFSAP
jgi:hypothetical protein